MPELLTSWYSLYNDLEIIIKILVENMGREVVFSEFHFKDIVQALESFHRKRVRNERMPKADYKLFKEKILEQLTDASEREFVKERINYGNEPSLRERLSELVDRNNYILNHIISDKETFIKQVVDNRNFFTHLDASGKKNLLGPKALYYLSEKLLVLLFATIFSSIMDNSLLSDFIVKAHRWRFISNK